jgi:hypothetical protein
MVAGDCSRRDRISESPFGLGIVSREGRIWIGRLDREAPGACHMEVAQRLAGDRLRRQ